VGKIVVCLPRQASLLVARLQDHLVGNAECPVDDLGVGVGDSKNLGGLVAGEAMLGDHDDHLQALLVANTVVLALLLRNLEDLVL